MNKLQSIFYKTLLPDMYHGHGKNAPFFEGWYYKIVSGDEKNRYAIIPGVFLGSDGHAFIQVLNGVTGRSAFHTFPLETFSASPVEFKVLIGSNYFSRERVVLSVNDDLGHIVGEIKFDGLSPWPVSFRSPGIMGWYAWVPRMECYHGVVSLDHGIEGELLVDGQQIDFSGGRGYIEKDWGQSFPSAYVWMQSNHFAEPGASHAGTALTASVAMIPWVRQAFRGFIIGLWHNGQLFRFASYTGAEIEHLSVEDERVEWIIRDKHYRLEIMATRPEGGLLQAPDRVSMHQRVEETMSATVEVRLSALRGGTLYDGTGRHAGLEVYGDLETLLRAK